MQFFTTEECERIVAGVRASDEDAMMALYAIVEHQCALAGASFRISDTRDYGHDSYIKLVEYIRKHDLRYPCSIVQIARVILRRTMGHSRRREKRNEPLMEEDLLLYDPSNVEDRINTRQMREQVSRLHRKQRDVIVRHYLEEKDPKQVQKELDLHPESFRYYRRLGRRALLGAFSRN